MFQIKIIFYKGKQLHETEPYTFLSLKYRLAYVSLILTQELHSWIKIEDIFFSPSSERKTTLVQDEQRNLSLFNGERMTGQMKG